MMGKTVELFRISGYDSYKLVVYEETMSGIIAVVPDKVEDGRIYWKKQEVPQGSLIPAVDEISGPMLFEIGPQFAEMLSMHGIKSKSHQHALELARIHGEHIQDVRKALNLFLDAKKETFWDGITTGSAQT
jgi:hypothetical protein